ncbi:MAG TPA: serine hydrolase domain-containing protein [Thermomicrobiales bacterium]|nr:serine hydrolase domain-containing protein [Thermomicrobiales bacterium]
MPRRVSDSLFARTSRRSMVRGGVAAAALATAAPHIARAGQATPAAGPAPDLDAIDQFVSEALESYGVPGASVAVVQHGEPLLVKGYGVRSVDTQDPVDADTIFQLASNTKPMTSFTLATLVDEGAVDWTTPASEVLPELRLMDAYAGLHANARDLLAHRGGFPAFAGDLLGQLGYDRPEMLRRLRYMQPGSSFRDVAAYSNLGYFIVGEMVARLTGARWEDAMQARLFDPLGMTRSAPSLGDLPSDTNLSANHATVDGSVVTVEADTHGVSGAAGSALSTANDLVHWMSTLLSGGTADGEQVVQAATVRTMFESVIPSEISFTEAPPIDELTGFYYGLGWGGFHWHGYEVLEKGGALAGVRTVVELVPQLGLGVAVLANMNLTYLPEAIRTFVLEQFLGPAERDLQGEIREMATQLAQAFTPMTVPEDPTPLDVSLDDLARSYEQDLYGRFEIIAEGDVLRVEAGPGAHPASLTHYGLNSFLLDWGGAAQLPELLTFTLGPDGLAVAFATDTLGTFTRVSQS